MGSPATKRAFRTYLAIGLSLIGSCSFAQESSDLSNVGPPEAAAINPSGKGEPVLEAIQPANLTSEAAEFSLWFQQVETTIQPSPALAQLALDFSKQAQTLVNLRSELDKLTVAGTSARQLEEQRREWKQIAAQIDTWMQRANERWTVLQQARDDIVQARSRWHLASNSSLENDLPEDMRSRIARIIEQLDTVQTEVRSRLDSIAAFIEQLAEAQAGVSTALNRINDLTENVNRRLLTRDAPAIWQVQEARWLTLNETGRVSATSWLQGIYIFLASHFARAILQIGLFFVLLWACLVARKASVEWTQEEQLFDRARFLLARPVAVALTFSIVAGYFIYGPMPSAPRDLFYLLLVFPILYLSNGLTEPYERIGMYGLLILAGLFQLVQFCPPESLLMRVLLLMTEAAAIAICGLAIKQVRGSGEQFASRRRRRIATIYAALLLVFVVSLVANSLGWIHLAQFLTEGMLLTCKGAVLAILVFRAGSGLWRAFLRLKPGRAFLSVRRHTLLIERTGIALLALLLLSMWTQQTLRRFRLSDPLVSRLEAIWATPFPWAEVEITIGHVARALLIVAATILGQRVISFLLNEELFPRLHIGESTTASFIKLFKYGIVAIGLAMAVSALGFTATQLTVLFGALGVGIGFGLQNVVNNFVSGLILMFERPIKVGDVVEVGGNWGKIKEIGVRATSVMTFEGAEIVVPNGDLISKEVKNWTLSDSTARVEVLVGVAYGTDAREVLEILIQSAKNIELVFTDPEPFAMLYGFGDSALNFRLLCWTGIENRGVVTTEVHMAVYEALNEAGITIPFPQRDLNIKPAESALPLFDGQSHAD